MSVINPKAIVQKIALHKNDFRPLLEQNLNIPVSSNLRPWRTKTKFAC